MIFQVCFYSSLIGIDTRQSLRSIVILCKSGDKDFVLLQSHLTPHPCGATQKKC
ncbi:hypothetical protein PPIS_a1832 [Pseudoalteromonas piscicida]|uniref:Uncharacterized protein n=1 Tax=Pseudoalteromonas piscicida TaxID=43662 RepID=A0ABN5CBE3_PSEO7|nr:hypothetical protein PPIS_a1832 [Pseudoalteromonas piscicida]